jgi:hypothetical protein
LLKVRTIFDFKTWQHLLKPVTDHLRLGHCTDAARALSFKTRSG